jgi:hypothetical protein
MTIPNVNSSHKTTASAAPDEIGAKLTATLPVTKTVVVTFPKPVELEVVTNNVLSFDFVALALAVAFVVALIFDVVVLRVLVFEVVGQYSIDEIVTHAVSAA